MRSRVLLLILCFTAYLCAISPCAAFELLSPYDNNAGYHLLRGQLHCHTESVLFDRKITVKDLAQKYRDRGFDFVALTDHNMCSYASDSNWLGLTPVCPSEEITYKVSNLLAIGMNGWIPVRLPGKDDPQAPWPDVARQLAAVITAVHMRGGLVVVAHPDGVGRGRNMLEWEITPDTPRESVEYLLKQWKPTVGGPAAARIGCKYAPDAVAIYNGAWVVRGSGTTFWHYWDWLLSRGCRIWGTVEDDFHPCSARAGNTKFLEFTPGGTWVGVPAEPGTPWSDWKEVWDPLTDTYSGSTIKAHLYNGSFYAYWVTAPTKPDNYWPAKYGDPPSIKVSTAPGNMIIVSISNKYGSPCAVQIIQFRGRGGALLWQTSGSSAVYLCRGGEGYVRIEVHHRLDNRRTLYIASQPIFIK